MLADVSAQPTVAVRSLAKAKPFYETVLGLKPVGPSMPTVQCFQAGASVIVVYESEFAGSNKATSITWPMGEALDSTVADLKAKGVTFEHYDMPGVALEGDVHVGYGMRLAWFKDPDGNIINIGNF